MQQYNELNKIVNIIDTIFKNSKNSKTSDHHWLLFNFSDKVDLKESGKYVALSNFSKYYTWMEKYKKDFTETINLKNIDQRGMKNLNYHMNHLLYKIFKI